MVSHEKLKYVCIIGNIFGNTQSICKILAPKRNVFNEYHTYRKTLLQFLSYEGQQRSQSNVTVIKQMLRYQTICTYMSFV